MGAVGDGLSLMALVRHDDGEEEKGVYIFENKNKIEGLSEKYMPV
jgi:hypothetical protein